MILSVEDKHFSQSIVSKIIHILYLMLNWKYNNLPILVEKQVVLDLRETFISNMVSPREITSDDFNSKRFLSLISWRAQWPVNCGSTMFEMAKMFPFVFSSLNRSQSCLTMSELALFPSPILVFSSGWPLSREWDYYLLCSGHSTMNIAQDHGNIFNIFVILLTHLSLWFIKPLLWVLQILNNCWSVSYIFCWWVNWAFLSFGTSGFLSCLCLKICSYTSKETCSKQLFSGFHLFNCRNGHV